MSDLSAIKNWIYSQSSAGVKDERYQSHLRDVEQFFVYLFDNNPDGISVLDRDLNILGVNHAMERWYEHRMPLQGKKCFEAYHDRRTPCESCPTRQAVTSRKSVVGVVPYDTEHGKAGTQELLSFPLFDDRNEVIGVIEYVRDISRLEEEERVFETLKSRLQLQDQTLHEQETALRVLLRQRGREEAAPARNVASSVSHLVLPLVSQLEGRLRDEESLELVAQIREALAELTSPFVRSLASAAHGFTQRELEVASAIVAGRSSKEISAALGITTKAVSFHRTNMRRKLGLGRSENLRARLVELCQG